MSQLFNYTKNLAQSTLNGGYTAGSTSITVQTGDGALFDHPDFVIAVGNPPQFFLRVTAGPPGSDTFTVDSTGFDGSTPISEPSGTQITEVITAGVLASMLQGCRFLNTFTANNTSPNLACTSVITSAYDLYMIEIQCLLPATNDDDFVIEVSTNNGSTWDQVSSHYSWAMTRGTYSGGLQWTGNASDSSISLTSGFSVVSNAASSGGVSASLKLIAPMSGNKIALYGQSSYLATNQSGFVNWLLNAGYMQAASINAIRVRTVSGGNIVSGSITIYGLNT